MFRQKHAEIKKKKPVEFSKVIIMIAETTNLAVILFTCAMIAVTRDLSPLAYLIPAVAAEVATGTGFYYSKAKVENKIKLLKENGLKPDEQNFNEF